MSLMSLAPSVVEVLVCPPAVTFLRGGVSVSSGSFQLSSDLFVLLLEVLGLILLSCSENNLKVISFTVSLVKVVHYFVPSIFCFPLTIPQCILYLHNEVFLTVYIHTGWFPEKKKKSGCCVVFILVQKCWL